MESTFAYLVVWLFGVLLAGGAVLWLWNTTLPRIFPDQVRVISFGEALRLMILAWLLFGAGAFGLTYALGLGLW
jgi:maltodextrin utilization protein YvdJ